MRYSRHRRNPVVGRGRIISEIPGDYYDVGANHFFDIPTMSRTFRLLEHLGITKDRSSDPKQGCLIPHGLEGNMDNNPLYFNNILKTKKEAYQSQSRDPLKVSVENGGIVPDSYVSSFAAYNDVLASVFDKWKKGLVTDFDSTLNELLRLDEMVPSLRAYIFKHLAAQNPDHSGAELFYVTHWCETWTGGTRHFDQSFLAWLLLNLEFSYPRHTVAPSMYHLTPILPVYYRGQNEREPYWWILNGGTEVIARKTAERLHKKPLYNQRVTGIALNSDYNPLNPDFQLKRPMAVTMENLEGNSSDKPTSRPIVHHYSHVITTTTAPCLQFMDLHSAGLNHAQREAIRTLNYDNAVKVGIKFKRRWWEEDRGIIGGTALTDRPARAVIYPSQSGQSRVITASFCYGQDASRLGGLSQGSDPTQEKAILNVVIADLAIMHKFDEKELHSLVVSYHVHDWNRDPNANGHFAFLAPGQFSSFFGQIQRPAANGRLLFAGEMTSIFTGWIVGALNSAYRAVHHMLMCELWRVRNDQEQRLYVWSLIKHLEEKWGGEDFEPELEFDSDPKGIGGWQVFLGILGEHREDLHKKKDNN